MGLAEWEDSLPDRPATESEAHAEWHRNAGVPMGQPGCPWDACHDYPGSSEEAEGLEELAAWEASWRGRLVRRWRDLRDRLERRQFPPDNDDLPF